MPLVSVVIPVYNVEKYLGQCLDSIINQTLKDIEIICVDDGSTDNSLKILKEYKEKDNRIKILTQKNLYAGVARNTGLKAATGKYLSFLDSDDFFESEMLEEMYKKAEKDNSDIVMCGWHNYNNNLQKVVNDIKIATKYLIKSPFSPYDFQKELFDICKPNPWTKLYRHSFFKENNLYYEDCICCNDITCICLSMVLAKKISIVDKCFIYYRNNQTNSITSNRNKNLDSVLYAINKLEERLKEVNLYEDFKETFFKKAVISYNFGKNVRNRIELAKSILSPELAKYVINYRPPQKYKKYKFF